MNFFKIFLIIICLSLLAIPVTAQRYYSPDISIGGRGGMTLSRTSFSPSISQGWVMGALAGVTFRYMEEKNFGLIVELNMEQRGWKEKFDQLPFSYERTLTYLQLPLMTHIYFGSKKFHGFFNIGPEIGVMIGDSYKSNFDINNTKNTPDFPQSRHIEQYTLPINSKFDYGISAGLGGELFFKRNSIVLEGRFYYGLGNIFSSHKGDTFAASNGLSIMVSLGYMYRIK